MVKYKPMILEKEEKDRILIEAKRNNHFDYMLFLTLLNTGRRIGELYGVETRNKLEDPRYSGKTKARQNGKEIEIDKVIYKYQRTGEWKFGVRVKDIDFNRGIMKVWVLKRRKHIQDESVLSPKVLKVIKSWVRKNRLKSDDLLFRMPKRSYRNINNILKKYAEDAGVETEKSVSGEKYALSLHSFRHYFITELKRKGWTDDKIMITTGHKSIRTLSTYSHVLPIEIKSDLLAALEEM